VKGQIEASINASADALLQMSDSLAEQLQQATDVLVETLLRGGRLFTWGRGLSASLAQACSFLLHTDPLRNRPPFPAICLNTDMALMSQASNEAILEHQLMALAQPGDILITFSNGDNRRGLANAIRTAHARELTVVAFCFPQDELILDALSSRDSAITPFTDNGVIAAHTLMLALLLLCDTVEQQLFGGGP